MRCVMEDWKNTKCGTCKWQATSVICTGCNEFDKYIPLTRSMRFRLMSDEGMAEFFARFTTICEMCIHHDDCFTMTDERCRKGILQWLKSEAKE